MKNSEYIAPEIKEYDEPILEYLHKIEHKLLENDDFELVFTFKDNEYFSNE